jgi:hypothetical protein
LKIDFGKDFSFCPAKDTILEHNELGFFLISRAPIRIMRINEPLFDILQEINKSVPLIEICQRHPILQYGKLLKILFSLTYHSYYRYVHCRR